MYFFILNAHDGLRYLIFVVAVVVIVKSIIGWLGNTPYSKLDRILAPTFVGLMHLQLVLGLILYFGYSRLVTYHMDDKVSRYWSVEHISMMVLAIVAAQAGRSISKKSVDTQAKFRFQTIFFGLSLLLILVALAIMPGGGIFV